MVLNDVAWRPPTIETERLILRGYERTDVSAVYDYASDPDVARFMSWNRAERMADADAYLTEVLAKLYGDETLTYALTLRSNPATVIGGVGVFWRPRDHHVMELGYVLAQSHWGNGYVPEAAKALIAHAFTHTDVARIFAPIFAQNAKSRRTAEKIGLQFEGVMRSSLELRGQRWDEAVYAILRDDPR